MQIKAQNQAAAQASAAPVGNPTEIALGLLNGKTKSEWLPAAVSNATIASDPALITAISNDSWLTAQVAAGKVTENPDGTYSVN